jgi:hypothetical protein
MAFAEVKFVIDPTVRGLCARPYPGHPKGCPNFNERNTCPPRAKLVGEVIDLSKPTFVIWNRFDMADHTARLKIKHPDWTDRQLRCCYYWQGGARKKLGMEMAYFLGTRSPEHFYLSTCPEAMGVNVTATMAALGIELEWPPVRWAYQVAIAGTPQA